ncbi:uncharacterized protein [Amphiura filiformis]|uniref:uncharacterized protein n=1 Tax=Amphiura filiformis TaxID=82378 RepID=UPI003B217B06
MGCRQSNTKEDVDTEKGEEKINEHNHGQTPDVPTGNMEKDTQRDENKNQPSPDDKTISETDTKHEKDNSTSETAKQNGYVPPESMEMTIELEEERLSALYAKPDKKLKANHKPNADDNEMNLNDHNSSKRSHMNADDAETNAVDAERIPMTGNQSEDESSDAVPEGLYAKPNKKADKTIEEYVPSSQADEPEDDYATIRDTQKPSEQNATDEKFERDADYEDVNLRDVAPPPVSNDAPPRLPTDSLTRPPRKPISEDDDMEPPYAESTVFDTRGLPDEKSDASKSASIDEDTAPYAQTQIVPLSGSSRKRFNSHEDEEPIVELGSPGVKKPSIRMAGSKPTEIDIPDSDYEKVVLNTENGKGGPDLSKTTKSGDTNDQSGWAQNPMYSSVDDPTRDSNFYMSQELSPERVAKANQGSGLATEEDDYEEIRRSLFANTDTMNISQTETHTIDGKEVPVTEL